VARSTVPRADATGVAEAPLWRAAAAFRLVTVLYVVGFQLVVQDRYDAPRLSWLFVVVTVIWSGIAAVATLTTPARRPVVVADQIMTPALICSTLLVASPAWRQDHQVLPTTIWVANAVIGAAVLGGPRTGLASAAVMTAAIAVVRGTVDGELWRDSTGPVLLSVGLALGLAARTARLARSRLDEAVALAAATAERERLAREVHDGVLQVLAMVSRRGHEIGGAAAELADLAGSQEAALRALLSGSATGRTDGTADLAALVRAAVGTRAVVSAPSEAVVLRASAASELAAATLAAVDNAHRHGGSDVHVFVLVEDLGDEVMVTVRDDGAGMAPGRLDEARAEGRLGVSGSIVGRTAAIGGRARVDSRPGEGTEWELTLPRTAPTPR
jgi:signal transduction histidine kinase